MAWYSCELSFLVQYTPAALGGLGEAARGGDHLRDLERPWRDYLFGQVSGSKEERSRRKAAVREFLHGPDCRFLLAHPPGREDGLPDLDELRQRAGWALAVYHTLHPDLRFAPGPLGDPTNLRWQWRAGRRVLSLSWQLTVVDRDGAALALPPDPARPGAWHLAAEVVESG